MSNACKCDRCGALYEPKLIELMKRKYRVLHEQIPDNYSHYLDLCNKCQDDLEKWIEEVNE